MIKNFLLLLIYSYASIASLSAETPAALRHRFDSIAQLSDYYNYSSRNQEYEYLSQLRQLAEEQPSSCEFKGGYLYREAECLYEQGIYDSTLTAYVQQELLHENTANTPFYLAQLQYAKSLCRLTQGNYADAFTMALNSLEYFQKQKDSLFISKSLLLLGRVYSVIESWEMAQDCFSQGLQYTNPSRKEYYQTKSNLYYIYFQLKAPINIIDSLQQLSYELELKGTEFMEMIIINYLNMGSIYDAQQEYDKAYIHYKQAQEKVCKIDNKLILISLYQNMGSYYISCQNTKKAYENFLIAKKLAYNTKNPNLIAVILPGMSLIHEQRHRMDSAYYYLKEYNSVKIKNLQNSNLIEAYQAYVSFFLEASKKEIIIKDQELKLNQRRYIVTIISGICILLIITSLLVIFKQQQRYSRQQALLQAAENRELEERLEADKRIRQLQEERIESHVRELSSFSLALSSKNNILQQIGKLIEKLPGDPSAIEEARQIIKNNLNINKVWSSFMVHFDKVHPDFFNRIKCYSEEFSENDLRLCAYLRIGMSTKQIAQMLNVSPESIRMHRYRIKKKFGLEDDDKSLDDFIRNI